MNASTARAPSSELNARTEIGEAIGILMERHRWSSAEASRRLGG
ncbi:ANTAR domain-containing protein [Actinopolymorpha pittospori]